MSVRKNRKKSGGNFILSALARDFLTREKNERTQRDA
jgi:hypothetical protein